MFSLFSLSSICTITSIIAALYPQLAFVMMAISLNFLFLSQQHSKTMKEIIRKIF